MDVSQAPSTWVDHPWDEFLSQLLYDAPDTFPKSNPTPADTSGNVYTFSSSLDPIPVVANPSPCCWAAQDDPSLICGAELSNDIKHTRTHFRLAHDIRGNDKVMARCLWHGCQVPPMQRGSVIRHVLAVHLRLLRWQCGLCGRVFARKGTAHPCLNGAFGLQGMYA